MKREKNGGENQPVRDEVVPARALMKDQEGEESEYRERDALLHNFQLRHAEYFRADAVGGDLKDVLKERDSPTDNDHQRERLALVLQVAVPRDGHENVRDDQ